MSLIEHFHYDMVAINDALVCVHVYIVRSITMLSGLLWMYAVTRLGYLVIRNWLIMFSAMFMMMMIKKFVPVTVSTCTLNPLSE